MPTTTQDTCLICQNNFKVNDQAEHHGHCAGRFHSKCIKKWKEGTGAAPSGSYLGDKFEKAGSKQDKCPACNGLYGGIISRENIYN